MLLLASVWGWLVAPLTQLLQRLPVSISELSHAPWATFLSVLWNTGWMSHKRHLVGLSSFGWLVVVCVKRFHVWILPDLLTGPRLGAFLMPQWLRERWVSRTEKFAGINLVFDVLSAALCLCCFWPDVQLWIRRSRIIWADHRLWTTSLPRWLNLSAHLCTQEGSVCSLLTSLLHTD